MRTKTSSTDHLMMHLYNLYLITYSVISNNLLAFCLIYNWPYLSNTIMENVVLNSAANVNCKKMLL